jgi:hypothetical protein
MSMSMFELTDVDILDLFSLGATILDMEMSKFPPKNSKGFSGK